jgi:serine/threonine-protein kinase
VFLRRGVLFAVPFDPERLQVTGNAVPVVQPVAQALTAGIGAGQYAVSQTGTLAWVARPVVPFPDATIVTVDRQGRVSALPAPTRSYVPPVRLSRDGRRLGIAIRTLTENGMWVYDLDRETLTSLNRDGESHWHVWSNDDRRLFLRMTKDGRTAVAAQPVDGSSPAVTILDSSFMPVAVTADSQVLLGVLGPFSASDIYTVRIDGPAQAQPLIATPASEGGPDLSRDGRWLAFSSNTSGRHEVYVRPYPGAGPTELVSVDGGIAPCWHPNGRGLFFISLPGASGTGRMMTVEFAPGGRPHIGRPRVLFEFDADVLRLAGWMSRSYDVSPDGQRFYVVQRRPAPSPPPVTHIDLVLNWFEELKAKVPTTR